MELVGGEEHMLDFYPAAFRQMAKHFAEHQLAVPFQAHGRTCSDRERRGDPQPPAGKLQNAGRAGATVRGEHTEIYKLLRPPLQFVHALSLPVYYA
jgi:hypothetical protein